jgi:hypothetical protein
MVLVDFGLAEVLPEGQILREVAGTPEFMAPEMLNDAAYSKEVRLTSPFALLRAVLWSGALCLLPAMHLHDVQHDGHNYDLQLLLQLGASVPTWLRHGGTWTSALNSPPTSAHHHLHASRPPPAPAHASCSWCCHTTPIRCLDTRTVRTLRI